MLDDISLHPAWKQAVEDFKQCGFTYGDVVPLDWLYDAMQVTKPLPQTPRIEAAMADLKFGQQFGSFRSVLLEDHLFDLQKDATSNGYIVVRPEDQVPRAHKDAMHELRQSAKRAVRRMTFIAADQLTTGQRARDASLLAHFTQLRGAILRRNKPTMQELIEQK
jgi:hypothetical protein